MMEEGIVPIQPLSGWNVWQVVRPAFTPGNPPPDGEELLTKEKRMGITLMMR